MYVSLFVSVIGNVATVSVIIIAHTVDGILSVHDLFYVHEIV